ncbi:MAG: hypothetical protein AAF708_18760 [Deinococcota bacterium]
MLIVIAYVFVIIWIREASPKQKLVSPLVYGFAMLFINAYDQDFVALIPGTAPIFSPMAVLLVSWGVLAVCIVLLNSTHVNVPSKVKLRVSFGYAVMIFAHVIKFYRSLGEPF